MADPSETTQVSREPIEQDERSRARRSRPLAHVAGRRSPGRGPRAAPGDTPPARRRTVERPGWDEGTSPSSARARAGLRSVDTPAAARTRGPVAAARDPLPRCGRGALRGRRSRRPGDRGRDGRRLAPRRDRRVVRHRGRTGAITRSSTAVYGPAEGLPTIRRGSTSSGDRHRAGRRRRTTHRDSPAATAAGVAPRLSAADPRRVLFPTATFAIFFMVVLAALVAAHRNGGALAAVHHRGELRVLRRLGLALLLPARLLDRLEPGVRRRDPSPQRRDGPGSGSSPSALVGNLGLLGYFKYYDFFVTSDEQPVRPRRRRRPARSALDPPPGRHLLLHVQGDQLRRRRLPRRLRAGRASATFAAYLSFFPHLVAGPIVRPGELLPQLDDAARPALRRHVAGVLPHRDRALHEGRDRRTTSRRTSSTRSSARRASTRRSRCSSGSTRTRSRSTADFFGYTNIAIGIALLLGFTLPAELRRAVLGDLDHRLLAALAHDALALAARLPLHPARREPRRDARSRTATSC